MARMRNENQLGFDEELVENPDVEAALVARQEALDAKREVNRDFKKAHDKAKGMLEAIELPEEGAVRVGRFRITKSIVSARSVSFDTSETTRLRITLLGDEEPKAASRASRSASSPARISDDDVDLRPKGEVNADALRAEVERATPKSSGKVTPFRPKGTNAPAVH